MSTHPSPPAGVPTTGKANLQRVVDDVPSVRARTGSREDSPLATTAVTEGSSSGSGVEEGDLSPLAATSLNVAVAGSWSHRWAETAFTRCADARYSASTTSSGSAVAGRTIRGSYFAYRSAETGSGRWARGIRAIAAVTAAAAPASHHRCVKAAVSARAPAAAAAHR
jgi:hypothetical protein